MIYSDTKRKLKTQISRSYLRETNRHIIAYCEDGLAGVERFIRDTPRKWRADWSERDTASDGWDLGLGYEGAVRMARDGWSEGARELDARLRALLPVTGTAPNWGHSVAGSSVNVGRFLRGHPKCMRSRAKRETGSAPIFHLVVNSTASCMVTAKQMKNYGVAICGLIEVLERGGKRVILDILNCGTLKSDKVKYAVGWNVKQAEDSLDVGAVAFAIAHPAAFRRLAFAMIERLPGDTETTGYGHCADISAEDMPRHTQGMMLIDGISHSPDRCNSAADALHLAIEQLNKAAVLAGHSTIDEPLIDETQLEIAA